MAELSTEARAKLPPESFALPNKRAYPIHDRAHTRNAASRLVEEWKAGKVSDGDYADARHAIAQAERKFGIGAAKNKGKRRLDLGVSDVHVPSASRPLAKTGKKGLHMRIHPNGAIDVRHSMADREFTVRLDSVEMPTTLADAEAIAARDSIFSPGKPAHLVWIQLAKCGQWSGHPAGAFKLSPKEFSEIQRNFRATQNRMVAIDMEHASESDPTSGSIPENGAPAQGWILDIDNRGESGLWGLVEWKPAVAEKIRHGEFRFFSPAIRFGSKDRVTAQPIGARLTSGAITNSPFLDGLAPLAASDRAMSSSLYSTHETMPKVRAALKLGTTALPSECLTELGRVREMCMSAGPTGMHSGVNLGDYTGALKSAFPMAADATWDDLFDAVQDMIDAAIEQHNLERHDGATPDMGEDEDEPVGMTEPGTTTETAAMSDANAKETAELTIKLRDAEGKIASFESKTNEVALQIKAKDAEIAEVKAENVRLKAEHDKRTLADRETEVDEAIQTWGEKKGIGKGDRDVLLSVHAANPDGFRKLYPKVTADKRHLLTNVTTGAGHEPPPAQTPTNDGGPIVHTEEQANMVELTDKYLAKGMPLDQALLKADSDRRKAAAKSNASAR